jgi:flagellar motor switch protein FliM
LQHAATPFALALSLSYPPRQQKDVEKGRFEVEKIVRGGDRMGKGLSRSQIDTLLQAMQNGDLPLASAVPNAGGAKRYDFRRPNKLSNEQLRTLQMIHDNFSRLLTSFLSAYLGASVQVRMAGVEQMTYEDFILSLPLPTLVNVFTMEPLKGSAVMETNMNFTLPIIDLLCGGQGDLLPEKRELTELELQVLRRLHSRILEHLQYSWSDIEEIAPQLEAMDTNPQFNQAVSPNETVAVISLHTLVNGHEGALTICLPYLLLEPVASRLSARHWFSAPQDSALAAEQQAQLDALLGRVPVELQAFWGRTRLLVREFIGLQPADGGGRFGTAHGRWQ